MTNDSILFDKHDKPSLAGLSNDAAWAACNAFEDYIYFISDDVSDKEWDCRLAEVVACYAEYYTLFD